MLFQYRFMIGIVGCSIILFLISTCFQGNHFDLYHASSTSGFTKHLDTSSYSDTTTSTAFIMEEVDQFSAEASGSTIILTWEDPDLASFSGVTICRQDENCDGIDSSCTPLVVVNAGIETWIDSTVSSEQTYCYKAYAIYEETIFSSGVSDTATALDMEPPQNPTSFSAVGAEGEIVLTWDIPPR
jgi:hypothetical protein